MQKVCLGFGHLFQGAGSRCTQHATEMERDRDRLRGTRQDRGYGNDHYQARANLKARLPMPCEYGCGTMLHLGDKWVAAHRVDGRPEMGYLVSCVSCNERAKVRTQDRFRAVQPGVNAIAGPRRQNRGVF